MADTTKNNKLDAKIKESLSNYKANNSIADWSRMEEMLDAAPQQASFKWNYLLSAFIGLAVIGGGYFIYNSLNTTKTIEKTDVSTPQPKNEINSQPLITPSENVGNDAKENNIKPEENLIKPEAANKKENLPTEARTGKEPEAKTKDSNTNTAKPTRIIIMGNQPIFGDMLDSSKGIIGETKEKEATKKAAVTHSDKPIGWSKFINPDSIKKFTNQHNSDTLKTTPQE